MAVAAACEDYTFWYEGTSVPALASVTVAIEAGTFVGIVGRNASGKSTLCYSLAGLVPNFYHGRWTGRVLLFGEDAADLGLAGAVTRVGFVFHNPESQLSGTSLTVREEIAFGLGNLGLAPSEIAARTDETLALLGLRDLAARSPYALSGGQQQLVVLASVLAMRPRMLVLDEPTSELDPVGTAEVFALLARLKAAGTTLVVAEHKSALLAQHADRLLWIDGGRLRADGTPAQVFGAVGPADGVALPAPTAVARGLAARGRWTGPLPVRLEQLVEGLPHGRI